MYLLSYLLVTTDGSKSMIDQPGLFDVDDILDGAVLAK